ncbi:hypothetical protein [Nocardia alba]|uniref:Uncharacterized protein n=1 Tax=Nocardia alba TaxID=225051 RepID=A0A4V2P9J1_9NOCA|nr:hypothetical protein [Nocardia alba]TCJ89865.1 hypothetical protein DFR71_6154 [Nocardia alba]
MTKALRGGDAGKSAAARQRETDTYREFDAISRAVIDEGFGIVAASTDRLGQQLDQMKRSNTAGDARPRRAAHEPPGLNVCQSGEQMRVRRRVR